MQKQVAGGIRRGVEVTEINDCCLHCQAFSVQLRRGSRGLLRVHVDEDN